MKVNYEKEMFNVFIEYFRRILEGYMLNKDEDIFLFLMRRIKEDLSESVDKILYSIQFLSFYHALVHIKRTKVNTERENVFERIEEFREILMEFLNVETFPMCIVDRSIYSSEAIKGQEFIYSNFPRVYDNPDKTMNSFKKETNRFLIKSILDIAASLKKIGALKGMLAASNVKAKRHYVEKLVLEEGEPVQIDIKSEIINYLKDGKRVSVFPKTMYEIFSYNYLESLKTQELVFINLFWVNKFAKMVENILFYTTFFANRKTLLWGIKNGDVSKETILHFLDNDKRNEKTENILFQFKKIYEGNYTIQEYSEDDVDAIRPMYELLALSYILKDLCFYSALETEGSDKSIKNYGLVENSKNNAYTYAYVWDLPHFNLPITIHCGKSSLIYYFEKIRKESKVRTYIGYEDFFSKDKLWKNSFLYPISPDRVEYIKTKAKINNQLRHILFIQNGIWPEHMRDKNGKVNKHYVSIDDIK